MTYGDKVSNEADALENTKTSEMRPKARIMGADAWPGKCGRSGIRSRKLFSEGGGNQLLMDAVSISLHKSRSSMKWDGMARDSTKLSLKKPSRSDDVFLKITIKAAADRCVSFPTD